MKFEFKYNEPTDCWIGERLRFSNLYNGSYLIENSEPEKIGWIEHLRVGRFMHWCLFLEDGCYLSPGCQDEVRAFTKKLYSIHKKNGEKDD